MLEFAEKAAHPRRRAKFPDGEVAKNSTRLKNTAFLMKSPDGCRDGEMC